ncbi:TetR/AcrR family transcriptional regulator [Pararhodobacter sp.]|uniref:TetR/AcrR family transcriptional regulator n=1 Tax=Pararhodobacter sp. TaxID=2127056 RepID=UPI002B0019E9|nr:TetR/AcrR family transcriptional regulator [Pararhodobacter sp.]
MTQPSRKARTPQQDLDLRFANDLLRAAAGCRKGARTKAAIQSALCTRLETSSPVALTVAEICDAAGVAPGTFYIYFPDRNALIGDVMLRFIAFIQRQMRQASRQQADDPVRAATATYVQLFESNLGLMRCLLNHPEGIPEAQAAFQTLNRDWLESAVSTTKRHWARQGKAADHDDLMRRAYALGGMTDQYLSGLLLSQDPNMQAISRDRDLVIETLTMLWQRGMEP